MPNPGNVIGGHKAALHNPNVSEETKQREREYLEEHEGEVGEEHQKNTGNVRGGYKAAMHNPNVSDEAKQRAQEELENLE
ncbi:hypothetical protein POMI540_0440 [Schizosaccharomyces pombe]